MYAFISTISVYGEATGVIDEQSPVQPMPDGGSFDQFTAETYGALKALCEEEIEKIYGDKALIIRAGLQAGPFDHTDRFSNWVERIARRDVVVVPSGSPMPWQIIDARDTARFTLNCIEKGIGGTFNTTGPVCGMPDALEAIRKVVNPKCRFVEVTPEYLAEHEVKAWSDVALWLPESDRGGFPSVSIDKAVSAGLVCRPIEETSMDIRDRVLTLPEDRPRKAGLAHEREDALLAALANRSGV
jgi:2'-hydroxyisoflavone reductase